MDIPGDLIETFCTAKYGKLQEVGIITPVCFKLHAFTGSVTQVNKCSIL